MKETMKWYCMKSYIPLFVVAISSFSSSSDVPCRDRFLQPFANTSIWNTAIGSEAEFAATNLFRTKFPEQFHNDQEFFIRIDSSDTEYDWIDQGDWGGDQKCVITGKAVRKIRLPKNWSTASDCDEFDNCHSAADLMNNNPMGILLEDQETIVQMQPVYRCDTNGPLLARFGNETDGCPQQFPNTTSIFSDGNLGAHGGSGLSGVGGMVRLGELVNDNPIEHALKIELQHQWYFVSLYSFSLPHPKTPSLKISSHSFSKVFWSI